MGCDAAGVCAEAPPATNPSRTRNGYRVAKMICRISASIPGVCFVLVLGQIMRLRRKIREVTYNFDDLRDLLAKASPYRSGDALAGIAAESDEQRAAAQMTLADLPLRAFLQDALIPYETDEVTRLIVDSHNQAAFTPVATLTVGDFRDWLL